MIWPYNLKVALLHPIFAYSSVSKEQLMPERRMSPRRTEREQLVAYLHGIDPQGEVVHVLVHKRGRDVKFSGGVQSHTVSAGNSGDLQRWIREAEGVLGLEEVIGVHREWVNIPETLKKIDDLSAKAEEKKKRLAASSAV
jgi:hypothetical protein